MKLEMILTFFFCHHHHLPWRRSSRCCGSRFPWLSDHTRRCTPERQELSANDELCKKREPNIRSRFCSLKFWMFFTWGTRKWPWGQGRICMCSSENLFCLIKSSRKPIFSYPGALSQTIGSELKESNPIFLCSVCDFWPLTTSRRALVTTIPATIAKMMVLSPRLVVILWVWW